MSRSIPKCSNGSALLRGSGAGALIAAALSMSCSGKVVVGDAKDYPADCEDCDSADASLEASAPADTSTGDATTRQAPDCTDADAEARAEYDAWRSTPNALAELAGKTFSGYIEGGAELSLAIARNQAATLIVGEPAAPPVKDTAYLCGDGDPLSSCATLYDGGPLEGGTYPLHGASFAEGRLTVEVPQTAAVDPWCALQDPVLEEPDCYYSLVAPSTTAWGPNGCEIGGESVDCGWFAMANDVGPCRCTSTECFAGAGEVIAIDVRLLPEDGHLEGSLIFRENAKTVYLFPDLG